MNIKILHSWLSEYLLTNAKPEEIAKYLSLCGPSVEKLEKIGDDYSYDIEITTNRIDTASVYGIAREAKVILLQFGYKAELKKLESLSFKKCTPQKFPVNIIADKKLTNRIMAVVIENPTHGPSPSWMKKRLENAGIRSLDSIIDITNYVMTEIGHPTHVFDLDRLSNKKIIIRESKKGEKAVGLDEKTYIMPGGDIVFDDGTGNIIDLPGILGTKNSVVTSNTKRVLFFIDNNDPVRTRKTSMALAIRSVAATLNEKGVDPELAEAALARGIKLFESVCNGKVSGEILDINYTPYKKKVLNVKKETIDKKIGINISKNTITPLLTNLGFAVNYKNNTFQITIPSWRVKDIEIPEDIIEEIARIYGYFNLPSEIMTGALPEPIVNSPFSFEDQLKDFLKTAGGIEIYTSSLVSSDDAGDKGIKLKNPLGSESEYLRVSLLPSLKKAVDENIAIDHPYHLFELSNVYIFKKDDLPEEKKVLAGIFYKTNYREAKGILESLFSNIGINPKIVVEENKDFRPSSSISFYKDGNLIGNFGLVSDDLVCYELCVEKLRFIKSVRPYLEKPKYPPQIEDLKFEFPKGTYLGEVLDLIKGVENVGEAELFDTFENFSTFRIYYQNPKKTLDNNDVSNIRRNIILSVKTKFGGTIKG